MFNIPSTNWQSNVEKFDVIFVHYVTHMLKLTTKKREKVLCRLPSRLGVKMKHQVYFKQQKMMMNEDFPHDIRLIQNSIVQIMVQARIKSKRETGGILKDMEYLLWYDVSQKATKVSYIVSEDVETRFIVKLFGNFQSRFQFMIYSRERETWSLATSSDKQSRLCVIYEENFSRGLFERHE